MPLLQHPLSKLGKTSLSGGGCLKVRPFKLVCFVYSYKACSSHGSPFHMPLYDGEG